MDEWDECNNVVKRPSDDDDDHDDDVSGIMALQLYSYCMKFVLYYDTP